MWQPKGKHVSCSWLDLKPVRVLYEFDGPRIFVCVDGDSQAYLAYQCGESERQLRFLVVPLSEHDEHRLTTGEVAVRDVLFAERAWLFDIDIDWTLLQTWEIDPAVMPEDSVPLPGILLWPHLTRPAAATYANGHAQILPPRTVDS